MSDIVVDSCVMAKWVLPEVDSEQAVLLYNDVVGRGKQAVVLDVGIVETANAVWKKEHRGLIPAEEARRLVMDLLAIPVSIHPADKFLTDALNIAVKYDRSVYDALFVALANDLQLTGVTADEPLWKVVNTDFPNIVLLRDWGP